VTRGGWWWLTFVGWKRAGVGGRDQVKLCNLFYSKIERFEIIKIAPRWRWRSNCSRTRPKATLHSIGQLKRISSAAQHNSCHTRENIITDNENFSKYQKAQHLELEQNKNFFVKWTSLLVLFCIEGWWLSFFAPTWNMGVEGKRNFEALTRHST
jgi:hypothetical protein